MSDNQRWIPLESNPEVMNKFLTSVGVSSKWRINDVYGLDSELLATLPSPALAVLLLFPLNDKFESYFQKQEEAKKSETVSPNVYFLKQTVGNACGTIALIHAVANNLDRIDVSTGHLKNFLDATKDLSPDERAVKLEADVGLSSAHEESAQGGQTEAPSRDEKVNLHFIALVEKDGGLYELDGRKPHPVPHGNTTRETFLEDAAKVCRELMAVDPEEVHFTLVALTAAE
ncbi:ubiquitin carboxyl-terminal hydrolase isozyme L3-like [Daphnia pulicaria]|uniref:ubiquitin carboxyl-terminal hydrolase isozyme L3-like n=1 Tax=Daphnia pulicaria TaxID=35523 RepID=UPI001EEB42DF|nr:ubiquitin carboxyl-terminal hydrolase isozyme L3-like [Daphnia pulicaria]